jgi:hypothetical protein
MSTEELIVFTIQNLEGKIFDVAITQAQADAQEDSFRDKYPLDYLNDAISKKTGIDSAAQELVADEVVTIETDLLALVNKPLTLLVKQGSIIRFVVCAGPWDKHIYPIYKGIPFEKASWKHPIISSICDLSSDTVLPDLQVVGITRSWVKVELRNIPEQHLVCLLPWPVTYNIKETDPCFVYFKYQPAYMKIIPN